MRTEPWRTETPQGAPSLAQSVTASKVSEYGGVVQAARKISEYGGMVRAASKFSEYGGLVRERS